MQRIFLIVLVCIGIVTLSFIDRWQEKRWHAEQKTELHAMARLCQSHFENAIESRFNAIEALSSLFALHPETKSEEFASFAAMLLKFNPPIRALQYADSKTSVTYVYPPIGNAITISKPMVLLTDPNRGPFVKKAITQKTISIQGPFELRQGGMGLVARLPIFLEKKFIGLAIGVYDVPVLVKEALTGINFNQFVFQLTDGKGRVFWGPDSMSGNSQEKSIAVGDTKWTITLNRRAASTHPPVLIRMLIWVCGGGILLSSLLLIYFSWTQTRRLERIVEERTEKLSQGNKLLADEIVERKLADVALRKSEEKHRKLVSNISDVIVVLDKEGIITYKSPNITKQFGWSPDDLIGKHCLFTVHPDDQKRLEGKLARILEQDYATVQVEYNYLCKNGSFKPVELTAVNMVDDPVIQGVLANYKDITHRIQANKEISKSEKEMESIFRAAPTGIGVICDRVISQVNDRFCEIIGYSKNELIGKSARMVYPTDEEYVYVGKEKYRQISKRGTGTVETKLQKKDGKIIEVLLSSTPIDLDDLSKGVTFTALDITYLKTKESELLESEEKYRTMMEAMDDAAYICSSEYLVEYMNPSMIKTTGRDATGEPCHQVIHGLDEKCPWCIHEKVINSEYINYEVVSPKDNKAYYISNSPISHTDGSISTLAIFRDITEFKKMETNLQQAQKIEAIGALAGGIAHDFNNILFPVIGFAEMLKEDLPENSDLHKNVDEILAGANRARDLVQQILTFSRQNEEDIQPLKPHLIIKEVSKLIRSVIPTSIEIKKFIDPKTLPILADPTQIHQVAMNLITNAYQAIQESVGVLTIRLQNIADADIPKHNLKLGNGPHILFSIGDTGIGIDKFALEKIFDPYYTTKPKGKGTGLGLSVVHGIVTKYGGDIIVNSSLEHGTTFDIYLPAIKNVVKSEQHFDMKPIPMGNERILLVDDEKEVLLVEQMILERLGYMVEFKDNSIDALEAIKASPDAFDLIISDMTMPNMTGDKLAQKIMEIKPTLPIIICTGFSERISLEKIKLIGVKALLMKPIIKSKIAITVRKVLDEAKAIDTR